MCRNKTVFRRYLQYRFELGGDCSGVWCLGQPGSSCSVMAAHTRCVLDPRAAGHGVIIVCVT